MSKNKIYEYVIETHHLKFLTLFIFINVASLLWMFINVKSFNTGKGVSTLLAINIVVSISGICCSYIGSPYYELWLGWSISHILSNVMYSLVEIFEKIKNFNVYIIFYFVSMCVLLLIYRCCAIYPKLVIDNFQENRKEKRYELNRHNKVKKKDNELNKTKQKLEYRKANDIENNVQSI